MKLSEARPCSKCEKPLLKPPAGTWHVIRVSLAMVNPKAARAVMGLGMMVFPLGLAEVMAPAGDDAIWIMGDKDKNLMTELHLCNDCFYGFESPLDLGVLMEKVNRKEEETPA
jgi:hypothetical protein